VDELVLGQVLSPTTLRLLSPQYHSTITPHSHFINLPSTLFNLSYLQRRWKTHNKLLQDTQHYWTTYFFRYHSMALKMVIKIQAEKF